jgi:hypothetical protein
LPGDAVGVSTDELVDEISSETDLFVVGAGFVDLAEDVFDADGVAVDIDVDVGA